MLLFACANRPFQGSWTGTAEVNEVSGPPIVLEFTIDQHKVTDQALLATDGNWTPGEGVGDVIAKDIYDTSFDVTVASLWCRDKAGCSAVEETFEFDEAVFELNWNGNRLILFADDLGNGRTISGDATWDFGQNAFGTFEMSR